MVFESIQRILSSISFTACFKAVISTIELCNHLTLCGYSSCFLLNIIRWYFDLKWCIVYINLSDNYSCRFWLRYLLIFRPNVCAIEADV